MEFIDFYDQYVEKIYKYFFYRLQHRETAEDLTSLTFTKAFENFQRFDPKKGNFSSWIYRIAKNSLLDHYRKSRPTIDLEAAFDLHSNENIHESTKAKMELEKMKDKLKSLKQEHQDLIIMRVWDGLSYKEIAEITGKKENNLKVTFSRTISKLNS